MQHYREIDILRGFAIILVILGPVSYTHLDVYKRQDMKYFMSQKLSENNTEYDIEERHLINERNAKEERLSVSDTHRDVYKRQSYGCKFRYSGKCIESYY